MTSITSQPVGSAVFLYLFFFWTKKKFRPDIKRKCNVATAVRGPSDPPTFPADLPISIGVSLQEESPGFSCSQGPCSFGEVLQEQSDGEQGGSTAVSEHENTSINKCAASYAETQYCSSSVPKVLSFSVLRKLPTAW